MRIAFDSSTLILLQKIDLLGKITERNEIFIPEEVFNEAITKGLEKKHIDALELNKKMQKEKILVKKINDKNKLNEIQENFNLARGESETIVLFIEKKVDIIALDDLKALKYCDYYQIPFITAMNFVVLYCKRKLIDKKKAINMIENLGKFGRYKTDIIFSALGEIGGKK
ncbi:hypothetical protein CL617_01705 [archaeon]|nr:hypothetical protein [archaeon]|tara:strand:+ start:280 stop:789 length:510 start_codon:yes stop_codon:yes gene_type:complete